MDATHRGNDPPAGSMSFLQRLATPRAAVGLVTRPALADEELQTNWMDRALVAQTYEGRPMTTHHVLDVAVAFDRAWLFGAVDALVRSVPALRSYLRESPLAIRRFAAPERWSRLDSLVTFSDVALELSGSEWLVRGFDLAHDEPFRLLHAPRHGGGYQLVFTLHHGVTDGVGALALFGALLAHYGVLSGERDEPPVVVAADCGRLRTLVTRPGGTRLALSLVLDNVRRARRFTDRRASLLEREAAQAGALHYVVLDLPTSDWERLGERANTLGCSRNDLMLTALLRAAAAWRRAEEMPDEDFRALIPVDLRRELGMGPSLGNHLGVMEAEFTAEEIAGPTLHATVRVRLKAERAAARVLATPMALAMLTTLPPRALRAFFRWLDERPSSFMYSFLFSHIRVPDRLGVPSSIRAQRLYCLSSLPRQPGVGVTVTALPGSITIVLAYTPPRLSDAGAASLMARFSAALEEA